MVCIRIMSLNNSVVVPSSDKYTTIEDIINSIDLLNIIHYPYKLEYAGKILNDNVKSLVSELNINEETTIFLHNNWNNVFTSLNNEISSLTNINNDINKNIENEKIINNDMLKNIDNVKNLNVQLKQKHVSELTRLNNEIASLKNINIQKNQTHLSEKEQMKSIYIDSLKRAELQIDEYRTYIEHVGRENNCPVPPRPPSYPY